MNEQQTLADYDRLLEKAVRLETIVQCAKVCADNTYYWAAQLILALAEESNGSDG